MSGGGVVLVRPVSSPGSEADALSGDAHRHRGDGVHDGRCCAQGRSGHRSRMRRRGGATGRPGLVPVRTRRAGSVGRTRGRERTWRPRRPRRHRPRFRCPGRRSARCCRCPSPRGRPRIIGTAARTSAVTCPQERERTRVLGASSSGRAWWTRGLLQFGVSAGDEIRDEDERPDHGEGVEGAHRGPFRAGPAGPGLSAITSHRGWGW